MNHYHRQSNCLGSSTSEAVLPGPTIPYFQSRKSCNSSGKYSASSCQVSTLNRTRNSADLTAASTSNHASRKSGRRLSCTTQKLQFSAYAASTLRISWYPAYPTSTSEEGLIFLASPGRSPEEAGSSRSVWAFLRSSTSSECVTAPQPEEYLSLPSPKSHSLSPPSTNSCE